MTKVVGLVIKGENLRHDHRLITVNTLCFKRNYSRTSMARTPLGPGKYVRNKGSSS